MEALWTRQTTAGLAPGIGPAQTGRLTAEVGYGFAAFARGMLTPYAGTSLADGQARTYRLGTRWAGNHGPDPEPGRHATGRHGRAADEPGPPAPSRVGVLRRGRGAGFRPMDRRFYPT